MKRFISGAVEVRTCSELLCKDAVALKEIFSLGSSWLFLQSLQSSAGFVPGRCVPLTTANRGPASVVWSRSCGRAKDESSSSSELHTGREKKKMELLSQMFCLQLLIRLYYDSHDTDAAARVQLSVCWTCVHWSWAHPALRIILGPVLAKCKTSSDLKTSSMLTCRDILRASQYIRSSIHPSAHLTHGSDAHSVYEEPLMDSVNIWRE